MELKQEINYIEDKVIKLLYETLLEWQEKNDKDYFVVENGNYFGVKYIDPYTDVYAIPLGGIYADGEGNVRYCGREDYTLPDFHHTQFDYEEVENYKTLKKGDMIMSDIYELYRIVKSKL